jgi:hypothetical protein
MFCCLFSSVGIATGYALNGPGSIPGRNNRFIFPPYHLDQLWDPPSLLSNGYRELFRGRKREADHWGQEWWSISPLLHTSSWRILNCLMNWTQEQLYLFQRYYQTGSEAHPCGRHIWGSFAGVKATKGLVSLLCSLLRWRLDLYHLISWSFLLFTYFSHGVRLRPLGTAAIIWPNLLTLMVARGSVVGWSTILRAGRLPVWVPNEVDFFFQFF